MKLSRSAVRKKANSLPELKFEDQALTSFSGLLIFQKFFALIGLKSRLSSCFRGMNSGKVYDRTTVFLQLIIHVLLGYRELKDSRYYRDDPLVKRVLGLAHIPDTATLSRMLKDASAKSVEKLRILLREIVCNRLKSLAPARVTLDFDGSVQSTTRHAEGTAVGFNKKKKGARSYYPLFCTVAQTGQVFDVLHRAGNVHDSNGAKAFILGCINVIQAAVPGVIVEVRMDAAFFSDEIVAILAARGVEFTISVPFERFAELKQVIARRRRWRRVSVMDGAMQYFESPWKPKSWNKRFRFLFIRTRSKKQQNGPIQLDIFEPHEYGYEFKVIITNKTIRAKRVTAFHEGRGSQENVFGELKSNCQLDYVPVRTLYGNQTFLLACLFAYNLTRELQMHTTETSRHTNAKRTTLWTFEKVDTLRKTLIQRAGRLTRPQGVLTLTVSANQWIQNRLLEALDAIQAPA